MLSAALLLLTTLSAPDLVANDLEQAQSLADKGQLSQAADLLTDILRTGSDDERAVRLALADVRLIQRDPEQALDTLSGLDPDQDHDVSLLLGQAYDLSIDQLYSQGAAQDSIDAAFDAAQANLERAFELRPIDDSSAVWHLGRYYLYRNNWTTDAIDLANEALDDMPDDGEAFLLRGAASAFTYWEAFQNDNVDVANEIWQQAVDDLTQANELLSRDRIEPLGQLVWFYEVEGDARKAVDAARSIADRTRAPDLSLLYRLALKYRRAKEFDPSGRALEKMVEISARSLTDMIRDEPDATATARLLTGSIDSFYRRGDRAACRSILSAIVASEPKDHWVWDQYAVICTETSRFEDAIMAYEKAIEIDPQNPRTYSDLGAIYQHSLQREPDKSRELYEKCIAIADGQLAMVDLDASIRQRATDAKGIAQGNLNNLLPQTASDSGGGGGLLDAMMAGLRGLNLPSKGEGDDDEEGEESEEGEEGEEGEDGDSDEDDGSTPR